MEQTTTKLLAATAAALAGMFVIAPRSSPAAFSSSTQATRVFASSPPRSGRPMHWFHSHATVRSLERRGTDFGSTIVVGVDSMGDVTSLTRTYGLTLVHAMPALHAAEARVDAGHLQSLLAAAPSDQRVRYVSSARPTSGVLNLPSDPLVDTVDPQTNLPYEWQFASTHLAGALALSPGDPRIQVGVIDSGVDAVPDLAGKIDGLYTVTPHGTQPSPSSGNDDLGHGTAVASLIAATNGDNFGMAGFGGAAHVIGIHAGKGGRFSDADMAQALMKLDALGARIVNLSIGGFYPSSPILVDAIHKAATDGMLIVAASGNEGGPVDWPAALLQRGASDESYGLAVGATNVDGSRASFSNFGTHLSLVAPGVFTNACSGVLVALPPENKLVAETCSRVWKGSDGAEYGYMPGTSFATPEVAGVAALVWAARPELKNYQVADIIKASADRAPGTGWTPTLGCGRLDAAAAVELALSRTPAEWESGASFGSGSCAVQPAGPPGLAHNQTITFHPIPDRTTADGDFRPGATSSSGLPIRYTAYGGCTMRGGVVHVTGASLCWITAFQDGNGAFCAAYPVLRVVAITDALKPTALPAAGAAGGTVNLRYRSSSLGIVAADVTVERHGRAIAQWHRRASVVDVGSVYSTAWHAPVAAAHRSLRFCITFRNRTPGAPARHYTSCAPIRLSASRDT